MRTATFNNCLVCGKSFKTIPSFIKQGRSKYCSRECYFSTIKGKKGKPSPQKGKHLTAFEKNCLVCETPFLTNPSRIAKGQGKYCSRKCYYQFEKGVSSWNKDKSWSDEYKKKMSESFKGRTFNTSRTHFKKGQVGWSRGKKRPDIAEMFKGIRPEKAIEAAKIANKGNSYRKGKTFTEESKRKISEHRKGKMKGELNNNWKNGVTPIKTLVRALPEYHLWRKTIYERDEFKCVICGKGGYLEADHCPIMFATLLQEAINLYGKDIEKIRLYQPLWDINNGRTTCREHNPRIYVGNKFEGGIYR